jgi:beta-catenin-like protein 1
MDVEELLSYTPSQTADDEEYDQQNNTNAKKAKRRKLNEELDQSINAESVESELDETALKRLLLQFERKVLKNQEMRIKFGDNPTKFMDSEMELFDTIQEMHVLSTQPELYHIIVNLNIIPTLLGLLSHENTDISCAVVSLLQELSDLDDVQELNDVSLLLEALINGQVIALLVTNMERLDETVKEEAEGVYNSLG